MLVKINTSELLVGMHIKEFCGPWLEHPFWRSRFLLSNEADLKKVQTSGVKEVWIDTAKGLAPVEPSGHDEKLDDEPDEAELALSAAEGGASAPEDARPLTEEELQALHANHLIEKRNINRAPARFVDEVEKASDLARKAALTIGRIFESAANGKVINFEALTPIVEAIADSVHRHPDAMICVAREKSKGSYSTMHAIAVSTLMIALAEKLNLPQEEVDELGLAGMLCDIGMAVVPMSISQKKTALLPVEITTMRAHVAEGLRILAKGHAIPRLVAEATMHHHERVDGSGYPRALKADAISLAGKMAAICDVYDALTSNRPHKVGLSPSEAMGIVAKGNKTHFDEKVFQAFVKTVGIFPVGSLVKLASGHLAVVCEQCKSSLITPVVKVFYHIESGKRIEQYKLNLEEKTDKIISKEDPANYRFGELEALWRF